MVIELLTIGDELLDGATVDTNSVAVGRAFEEMGLRVARRTTLRDDMPVLARSIAEIAARADVCIASGGLGPTLDDLTVDALAAAAGVDLVEDPEVWVRILNRFDGRAPPPNNRRQTRIPVGGRPLHSDVGTAPGIELTIGRCTFYALPGVPRELVWHLNRHVMPALAARRGDAPLPPARTLRFVGIGESALAARVERLVIPAGVRVAYRTRDAENEIRLRADDVESLETAAALVVGVAPEAYVGADDIGLVEVVLEQCRARGLTLGVAESCTGGLVGTMLTTVPGASDVFRGGIVAYADAVKTGVLGVPPEVLAEHGAVSEATAAAMAAGAQRVLGCDVAVAVTGIAGPTGGTPEKPVGTVCLAWAGAGLDRVTTVHLRGDRERIRVHSAVRALDVVRRGLRT